MSLAYDYIKRIHAAKSEAHLDDATYRQLLFRVTGVNSSKDLVADQVPEILHEIKELAHEHRDGWQLGQLKKFKQYRKMAKLNENEAREILHEVTGLMNEASPKLDQPQFEHVMAALETRLEEAFVAGKIKKLSDNIDLRYWRGRVTGSMATTRQTREINDTWLELCRYLPEDKRTDDYLQGIIAQAAGRKPGNIKMTVFVAKSAIDALKRKLEHEKSKPENVVPF